MATRQPVATSNGLAVIGKRVPLKDAYEKVTGSLEYAVDFSLPGMLVAKVLRSPYAHARIKRIDTSKAEALTGVAAAITYQDVPDEEWLDRSLNYLGPVLEDRPRFAGREVAAVAAVDYHTAEAALRLIEIEWEELPHVFDIMAAVEPGAPQVASFGNVREAVVEEGDLEQGFAAADLVIEHDTRMGQQQHAPLGRNAAIARWKGDKLTLWTSTQTPFQLRDSLARHLGLPQNKVRVVNHPAGASNGLWWTNNFHFLAAHLARKAGKPVKLELTQEECFATVKRRDKPVSKVRLGLKRDGTFTAIHFKHYFDNGAYGYKPYPYESVSDLWGGQRPAIRFEYYGVSTNLVTAGCMRGVGDLSMGFTMEQAIDRAAEALGLNPLEIRLKNHIRAGDPIYSQKFVFKRLGAPFPGEYLSSGALDQCILKGAEAFRWSEKWKGWGQPTEVDGSKRRGVGMATATHICGGRHLGCPSVVVKVNHDGTVHIFTGVGQQGQGADTTQAQIAAEALGVPVETFVGTHGDTDTCPWSPATVASVNSHQTGMATRLAAVDARRQVLELAGLMMEVAPEDLDIKNGVVFVKGSPDRSLPFSEVTSMKHPVYLTPPDIIGRATANLPESQIAKMFMSHFVELEVDTDTGEVKVLNFVGAHDSGTIINPSICENQVYGGFLLGAGHALTEDMVFDEQTGRVLNPSFLDYKVLTTVDMPTGEGSDMSALFADCYDPLGPYGVKSIGEGATCPVPAAVGQALYNALGIRLDNPPFTPEAILEALRQQRNGKEAHSNGHAGR
ncbi:MAG: xanthine dehydrogenase family protein molybdopterin-binding subunit [Chloroflexi bacterium]|nr:xanthine dehydrogenase family protein molybdopterin-binding subunit [Chloroflexota bacterium]